MNKESFNNLPHKASSQSKRRPKNPHHKLYRRNHRLLYQALCKRIFNGRVDIKASELYKEAKITGVTFYFHFQNSNDVLVSYEAELESDFLELVPSGAKKSTVFAILTNFVIKNQQYFLAVNNRKDHRMLDRLISNYRKNLVGERINDETFTTYAGKIAIVLSDWLTYKRLTPESAPLCVRDLMFVRTGRVW